MQSHPLNLGRLLQVLTPNLDHARVVHLLRKQDALYLATEYMKSVQKENLSVVNEALNDIFIAEEDYEALRVSIDDHDNFDQIYLAQKVSCAHFLLGLKHTCSPHEELRGPQGDLLHYSFFLVVISCVHNLPHIGFLRLRSMNC